MQYSNKRLPPKHSSAADNPNPALLDQRRLLILSIAGGVLASLLSAANWTKPLVRSVLLPAHAQNSLDAPRLSSDQPNGGIPAFSGGAEFQQTQLAVASITFRSAGWQTESYLSVNGVQISAIPRNIEKGDSSETVAAKFAMAVNQYDSTPNYTATAQDSQITITQTVGSAAINGLEVKIVTAEDFAIAKQPFAGGNTAAELAPATTRFSVSAYDSQGNDGTLQLDGVPIDLGDSDLTAAQVAEKIVTRINARPNLNYTAKSQATVITLVWKVPGQVGNGETLSVQDGIYST